MNFAEKKGYQTEEIISANVKQYEKPFDSDRKLMTIVCKEGKKKAKAYIKGAPEELIEKCNTALINGKKKRLTKEDKEKIRLKCEDL